MSDNTSQLPAGETEQPVVVRRTRRAPFKPPQADSDLSSSGVTVSRNWALGTRSAKSANGIGLSRNRKLAGDLPAWAPLPPGELLIDRKSS